MKTLADRMQLAKTVLEALSQQPIRRKNLEQIAICKGATRSRLEGIIRFLSDSGYIQKADVTRFSKYCITEKGCKLLEALK